MKTVQEIFDQVLRFLKIRKTSTPKVSLRERHEALRKDVKTPSTEELIAKEKKKREMMDDSLCVYVSISTRGPNREQEYEKLLAEETKEMAELGFFPSKESRTTFIKYENSGSNSQP